MRIKKLFEKECIAAQGFAMILGRFDLQYWKISTEIQTCSF
jgi:hypothetical protein